MVVGGGLVGGAVVEEHWDASLRGLQVNLFDEVSAGATQQMNPESMHESVVGFGQVDHEEILDPVVEVVDGGGVDVVVDGGGDDPEALYAH